MKPTISVIVPALNEESNIEAAVRTALLAIGDSFSDYEVILVDDGSTDRTGELMDAIAAPNLHVRVEHNRANRGLGYCYRRGVELTRMEYVTWLPGDNDVDGESMRRAWGQAALSGADVVVVYIENMHIRAWYRRVISRVYTQLNNLLFGLDLKYINGPALLRTAVAKSLGLRSDSFGFAAESLVRAIRTGHTFVEVPGRTQPRSSGNTKAFRLKNVAQVISALLHLGWDIRVRQRETYSRPIRRLATPCTDQPRHASAFQPAD